MFNNISYKTRVNDLKANVVKSLYEYHCLDTEVAFMPYATSSPLGSFFIDLSKMEYGVYNTNDLNPSTSDSFICKEIAMTSSAISNSIGW